MKTFELTPVNGRESFDKNLDTRELVDYRKEIEDEVLIGFNKEFKTNFDSFTELKRYIFDNDNDCAGFTESWCNEFYVIDEINELEDFFDSDKFNSGVELINSDTKLEGYKKIIFQDREFYHL